MASLLWIAHFGMRIYGGSCSHLVDHTSILLIFQVNFIGHRSFFRGKIWRFLMHTFLHFLNLKNQRVVHAKIFCQNSSSPMFQDPTGKSHFNLKLVRENSTTNIEWNVLKTTFFVGLGSWGLNKLLQKWYTLWVTIELIFM